MEIKRGRHKTTLSSQGPVEIHISTTAAVPASEESERKDSVANSAEERKPLLVSCKIPGTEPAIATDTEVVAAACALTKGCTANSEIHLNGGDKDVVSPIDWHWSVASLVASCIFFLFSGYINALMQIIAQTVADYHFRNTGVLLPDVGFSLLPYIPTSAIYDTILTTLYIITMLRLSLEGIKFIMILRRLFLIHGSIFIMRGFSIVMTVLPNPYSGCKPKLHSNPLVAAFFIITGHNYTCADVFFSGHAVAMTLMMLCWMTYTSNTKLKRIVVLPLTVLGWISIICTHFHYSVDVAYGIAIACLGWLIYHHMLIKLYKEYCINGELHIQQQGNITAIQASVKTSRITDVLLLTMHWFERDSAYLEKRESLIAMSKNALMAVFNKVSHKKERMVETPEEVKTLTAEASTG